MAKQESTKEAVKEANYLRNPVTGEPVRLWSFTSINPGLVQVLFPAEYGQDGRITAPPREARFGGDTGKMGQWTTDKKEEAKAMREKMKLKTVADFNVTETTRDPQNGDLVELPEEDDAT